MRQQVRTLLQPGQPTNAGYHHQNFTEYRDLKRYPVSIWRAATRVREKAYAGASVRRPRHAQPFSVFGLCNQQTNPSTANGRRPRKNPVAVLLVLLKSCFADVFATKGGSRRRTLKEAIFSQKTTMPPACRRQPQGTGAGRPSGNRASRTPTRQEYE